MSGSIGSETTELPIWLDKDYIQSVLRSYHEDKSIKVSNLKSISASAKGDNYVCIMSRILVEYTSDNYTNLISEKLIVKATLDSEENNEAKAAFDSYGVYDHELEMYEKVFPTLGTILTKSGYYQDIIPKAVKIDYDHQCILLEDLVPMGYKMTDFKVGLDKKHVELILMKLVKMHAASVIANVEYPGLYKNYERGILNKHSRAFDPFYNLNFEACAQTIAGWKGFESYGEKMLKLLPHFVEYGLKSVESKSDYFNVLIHGDLWSNNAMFKYNEKDEPVDVILLDFQFSCWTSPTVDLHYFLNTSLVEDLRQNHIEEFVWFYYSNLVDTLKDLKFTGRVPTLHQFWIEYLKTSFYALFTIIISQPLMMNDETAGASINCLLKNDDRSKRVRNAMYNNVRTKRNLQALIPVFDRRGLLDVEQ